MTRLVFDGEPAPISHPLWQNFFHQPKGDHMIQPVLTPDYRLIDDLHAHIAVLTSLPHTTETDAESIQRELGWNEAILHLVKRGGLSHAGREEARQVLAASREWVVEFTGEEQGHER